MKIPQTMWCSLLVNEIGNYKHENLYKIINISKLNQYNYIERDKETEIYTDLLWDISNDLSQIDIENENKLKDIFFNLFKKIPLSEKKRVFKNKDCEDLIFTKDVKTYFNDCMLDYADIYYLHLYRKKISQEKLKSKLKEILSEFKFNNLKNQPEGKLDYWENHLSGKEINKLLDLLELSGMNGEELKEYYNIGFFSEIKQFKYEKIYKTNREKIDLVEIEAKECYVLDIKINIKNLLNEENKLKEIDMKTGTEYLYYIFEFFLDLENFKNLDKIKMISYSKENYEDSLKKKDFLIAWLDENKGLIIKEIKEINNNGVKDIINKVKNMIPKLLLKYNLDNKLLPKNKKNEIKKI